MGKENLIKKESGHRSIAYTKDFRNLIREYPGIIRKIKEILRSEELTTSNVGDLFEFNEKFGDKDAKIKIEVRKNIEGANMQFYHLKLDVDDKSFFVKSEYWEHRGKGYEEMLNTEEVREQLEELGWVDTVEYKFGYQDDSGRTFFISEWINLPLLRDYMKELRTKIDKLQQEHNKQQPNKSMGEWEQELRELKNLRKQEQELDEKAKTIQKIFPEFHDLLPRNMLYDEKNGKVYLFDLFKQSQDLYADWG